MMTTLTSKPGRGRRIALVCLVTFLVLFLADIIVANVLVSFALKRPRKVHSDVMPEPVTENRVRDTVSENRKRLDREASEWVTKTEHSEVSVESEDGLTLYGDMFITDESSELWVIALHGYGYTGTRSAMYPYMLPYARRGYNILTPDLRAHGKSEGAYIGMGWLDRRDILKWIDLITGLDPGARIVLHGVSMGGAAAMMTAGEKLPESVAAVVEECGYSSVWQIFRDEAWYLYHVPPFPLLYTASFFSQLRAGYSFKEASALSQIRKTRVPVLFIHGTKDNFVHTEVVYELYEACPSEKELYIAEGAGHGDAYYLDPDKYTEAVFGFLAAHMERGDGSSFQF